jgi:hypothetical protein
MKQHQKSAMNKKQEKLASMGQDITHQQEEENHRRCLVAFKMDLQSIPDERLVNYTDGFSLITLKHESRENMPLCLEEDDDADGGVVSTGSNGHASVVSCCDTVAPTGPTLLFIAVSRIVFRTKFSLTATMISR